MPHFFCSLTEKSVKQTFTLKFTKPTEFTLQESSQKLQVSWQRPELSLKTASNTQNIVYVILRRSRIYGELTKWQEVSQVFMVQFHRYIFSILVLNFCKVRLWANALAAPVKNHHGGGGDYPVN